MLWVVAAFWVGDLAAQTGSGADHFSWGALPSTVRAGVPFSALIQARDLNSNLVTNFNGVVGLTELVPVRFPNLLITEVETIVTERVELSNLSGSPVDVSGWRVLLYDRLSWPGPKVTFVVPTGTICPGFGVFQVQDVASPPGVYPNFTTGVGLVWSDASVNNQVAVLLLDAAGQAVDFFCAVDAYAGFIANPMALDDTQWSGPPVKPNSNFALTYQRSGHSDHNNAADWVAAANSFGTLNSRLQTPFVAAPSRSSVVPSSVTLTNGQWSGELAVTTPGTNVVLRADDLSGHAGDSAPIAVLALPSLELRVPSETFKATPGLAGQGSVNIPQALSSNLTVALSSGLSNSIVVPPSLTILAGATNAFFAVTNLDNGFLEGPQAVSLLATASGFASGSAVITNYDRPGTVLTVSLPATVSETSGWLASGQVRSSLPVSANVAVHLTSSKTNKLLVPDLAIIPAGKTNAAFGFALLDDSYIDGNQTVTITATVAGWPPAQAQILVLDSETTNLTLSLPSQGNEGDTLTNVSVQISGLSLTNVAVTLTSDAPSKLQLPPSVIIPAGQTSVAFSVAIADDLLAETNPVVSVTASAAGFRSATRSLTVIDTEVFSFSISSLPVVQMSGQPVQVTIYALNKSAGLVPGYPNLVNLAASGSSGAALVSPATIGPFTNGVWSGLISVTGENLAVVVTASDGAGHSGSSNPFDVRAGQALKLPVSDIAFDPVRGRLWAGVQSGDGTNSQSVVAIDPASGSVTRRIPLGTEPGKLALSGDSQFLYVGLMTTGGVARINLGTGVVDLRFPLPPSGNTFAAQMFVPPGDAHALIVQMSYSRWDVGLFRDGVLQTNQVPPAPYVSDYHFAVYDSATNFYSVYPGAVRLLNLVGNGVVYVSGGLDPSYGGEFVSAGGLLFCASGAVYDPQGFRRLGGYPTSGPLAADANAGQVFFISGTSLRTFDLASFEELGQLDLPIASGSATKLLRCGSNLLAVATSQANLLLLQTPLVRQPVATDLTLVQSTSAPTAVVGSNFIYSLTISNGGPLTVTNAFLVDVLPADASFVSFTMSQGGWSMTNGLLRCAFGELSSGAVATVQLTIQPLTPGPLVNSVWIVGDGINLINSVSRQTVTTIFGPTLPPVARLKFNADNLFYDASRNSLWTSTRRFAGAVEYNLRSVNLSNGLPATAIPLGYVASKLALTADQNYLHAAYVNDQDGLNYTPDMFIRRANLISNVIDQQFLVVDMFGQQHSVADMIGIASYPSAIVVARSGPQNDIALYQNSVAIRRSPTDTVPGKLESNPDIPTRFYRLITGPGGGNVTQLDIGASAISVLGSSTLFAFPSTPENPLAADMRYGGGLMFSDIGIVANPEALTRVAVLPAVGLVCTDPASGLVFYLVANGPEWVLTAFNLTSLAPAWSLAVPGISGSPRDLCWCGPGRLAFRTTEDQVFVLNTAVMPHNLQSDLALTQTASAATALTNVPVTFTCIIANAGPSPALNVMVTNQLPPDATIVSRSSGQGTITNLSGNVIFQLGDVQVGHLAWTTLVATWNRAGFFTNVATLGQATPDVITSNNLASTVVRFDTIPVSDLSVRQLPPTAPGGSGSNFVFTLIVSNAGPDTASNVTLSDTLYSSALLVSASQSQGSLSSGTDGFSANLGTLGSGAAATVTLTVSPCCGGMIQNEASTSSSDFDPNTADNVFLSMNSFQGQLLAEEVPIPAADIAYDPAQPGILASLAAPLGTRVEDIMSFDLMTRAIRPVARVGNSLGRVAVSDDSHFLYVALVDTGGVARIDLPAKQVDLRFALNIPSAPFGPYFANDLAVMPGAPNTLGVSRGGYAGYLSAVCLFDSGVQRPATINNLIENASYYRLRFESATNLYCTAPYGLQGVAVTANGLTNDGPLLNGYAGEPEVEGGLVFVDSGKVVNPRTGSLVATFPAQGYVAPDLANGRVYFLTLRDFGGYPWRRLILRAYDSNTQAELWSVKFDAYLQEARRLIKLGTNGLAFATESGRTFVVNPASLAVPTAGLSLQQTLSPTPVTVRDALTCTFTVLNSGPWTATGVVLTSALPANADFISATTTTGSCLFTNGNVLCTLGTLTNGESATVTVKLSPLSSGPIANSATLSQNEYDPNPTNNTATASTTVNPQPSVSINDVTVVEGTGPGKATISFTLTLSAPSGGTVTVGYQTADGTATAGQEYDAASGTVSISPGSTSRTLSLSIIRSTPTLPPASFFFLNLTSATNATIARTQAVATIVNRVFLTISVAGGSLLEGNSGFTNALFKFTLSSTSSVPVSFQYQTVNGTALAGSDFSPKTGSLVFPSGTTNLTLAVPVFGNTRWESNKSFAVQLSQPLNAVLGTNEATLTIVNDDPVPALAILNPPISQTVAQGASATFAVTAIGTPLPLNYQWLFNGNNLTGATNNALNLTNLQSSDAGNYAVRVANAAGDFTNRSAGLKVLARLNLAVAGNNLILAWTGQYSLQSATNVAGPYLDFPMATSPYTNLIDDEPRRFFRLRSAPANGLISTLVSTNNQFFLTGSGLAGYDYVLQASTNLTDWISIQTNAAPFRFADPGAANLPVRFYRTIFVP